MSKKTSYLEQLIHRYLTGKTTSEENKSLQQWIETLKVSTEEPTEEDIQRLKSRIDVVVKPQTDNRHKRLWRQMTAAAAILLCISVVSFLILIPREKPSQHDLTVATEHVFSEAVKQLSVVYNHGVQNKKFVMSDGTEVTLKPKSHIRFTEGFGSDRRDIWLRGKALFKVAKDTLRPFSVVTGQVQTTALGTTFWVDHFDIRHIPTVSLLSGKVEISKRTPEGTKELLVSLQPGDVWKRGKVWAAKPKVIPPTKNPIAESEKLVESKSLAFHHTPMKEVFDRLAAHYQVTFNYEDTDISGMTFYGTYSTESDLTTILQHISLANELQITYDETTKSYIVTTQIINQSND